jgi:hypothetical protein
MSQLGHNLGLAMEPQSAVLISKLMAVQNLERRQPIQTVLPREIDHTGTTPSQLAQEFVTRNDPPG